MKPEENKEVNSVLITSTEIQSTSDDNVLNQSDVRITDLDLNYKETQAAALLNQHSPVLL